MDLDIIVIASILFLFVSFLYSTVGHAGASGYLAIMVLLSFQVESIKPISLVLNIIVSFIASYKFIRAGYFDKKIFLAFSITSIPMAFVGGYFTIEPYWFKVLAGVFLIISAILLLSRQFLKSNKPISEINIPVALILGGVIGLISGLLGVGGGIFLSPILILLNWSTIRNASGVSALFIFFNSILGLTGHYLALKFIPFDIFYFIIAVTIGGFLGSHYGSNQFNNKIILGFLFLVLLTAGLKFLLVG